ncbi:MAG: ribosome recycling factor [Anaerolineae bacterium]|nr:ribosome recycling factor [Anaerolineae bacterium]
MITEVQKDAEQRMKSALTVLDEDLAGLRTGRASAALVEKLSVDYYDVPTPLYQLAGITIPEPQQISIRPYDRNTLKIIEKAILASDLGLTPNNDGQNIRLNLPALTEERRKDLVKFVSKRVEEAKVAVRNVRRSAIDDLRKLEKNKEISENERDNAIESVDKLTNRYIDEIEAAGKRKEEEVMEV